MFIFHMKAGTGPRVMPQGAPYDSCVTKDTSLIVVFIGFGVLVPILDVWCLIIDWKKDFGQGKVWEVCDKNAVYEPRFLVVSGNPVCCKLATAQ